MENVRRLFHRKARDTTNHASSPSNSPATSPSARSFPLGIKLLHNTRHSIVDIIFIHGLTGDRENTWTANHADAPWPQALLPTKLPYARVLTFGYDAYVADWRGMVSRNRIGNHSMNLLTAIATYRENDDTNNRPIIFVCHSLGGLVCEDALVAASQRPENHLRRILHSTRGIVFLGTPHHGSGLAKWAEIIARSIGVLKQTNTQIIAVLKSDSEVLARIQDSFHTLIRLRSKDGLKPIEITCFYEELPLPGIGIVVPEHSAILSGYIPISIRGNHMDITKFEHPEDPGFIAVAGELRRWTMSLSMPSDVVVAGEGVPQSRTKQLQTSTSPLVSSRESVLALKSRFAGEATVERIGHASNGPTVEQTGAGSAPTGYFVPGWTILHAAVRNGSSEDVRSVLAAGMSPTCATDDMAWTPLWVAAATGNLEITAILLKAGANVNAMARDGCTAIHEAANIGATDIVELLIHHRADLNLSRTEFEDTPLIIAAAKDHITTVKALLTAGADVRAAQCGGWTALHYALLNKRSEMALMILEYAPDANSATKSGARVLHLAALAGMTSVVGLLLDMGAEIDAVDSGGLTALRVAVQAGELETVKMLIERGARTDTVDGPHQHTLMDVALIQGHTSIYLYLQQLSAG